MKPCSSLVIILLILPAAMSAVAQAQVGPFQHIIFIVQENRTPDNLFGSQPVGTGGCSSEDPFENGVDVVDGGIGYYIDSSGKQKLGLICNISLPLNGWDATLKSGKGAMVDPDHNYDGFNNGYPTGGWAFDYDQGAMDEFCHVFPKSQDWQGTCPPYSFVQQSDVQPYFNIATANGFANYMFQSNDGPSTPAHLFLFTGTSAPQAPGNQYANDYVVDLPTDLSNPVGCPATDGFPNWGEPNGFTEATQGSVGECYAHDSLVTDQGDCTNQSDGTDYCDRPIGTCNPTCVGGTTSNRPRVAIPSPTRSGIPAPSHRRYATVRTANTASAALHNYVAPGPRTRAQSGRTTFAYRRASPHIRRAWPTAMRQSLTTSGTANCRPSAGSSPAACTRTTPTR